jgi:hypothetical protein
MTRDEAMAYLGACVPGDVLPTLVHEAGHVVVAEHYGVWWVLVRWDAVEVGTASLSPYELAVLGYAGAAAEDSWDGLSHEDATLTQGDVDRQAAYDEARRIVTHRLGRVVDLVTQWASPAAG